MDTVAMKEAGRELQRAGVCVVPGYRSEKWCASVKSEVKSLLERSDVREAAPELDYQDKAGAGEPVIDRRGTGGRDEGMIDIFNVGKAIPAVMEVAEADDIRTAINASAKDRVSLSSTNVYVNRSVVKTRGFHSDSYGEQFKAFVYLTDVPDLRYGPYTYALGTHRPLLLVQAVRWAVNNARGTPATDAVFQDREEIRHCTGSAGTLVLSNQSGLHRGWPQEEGFSRMLISLSFTP
jgi:hypothetical protein